MFVQRSDKHTRRSSIVIHYLLKRGIKSLSAGEREKTPLREGWLLLTPRCVEALLKLHDETAP